MHYFHIIPLFILVSYAKPHLERNDLSDVEHNADDPEKHNSQYDHEAFLGKELAAEFDKLSEQEAKQRLAQLVKKIDQDGDAYLTESELRRWIGFVARTSVRVNTRTHWKSLNQKDNELLAWKDYLEKSYGLEEEIMNDSGRKDDYVKRKRNDERRWNSADMDFDNKLTMDEFSAFLHPQEYPRMRSVVIEETLQSIDTDGDGYVSLDEYLADLARSYSYEYDKTKPMPEWAEKQKEQFLVHRDKNGDKRMDRSEIGEWMMPNDYDPIVAEAKHLIYHSDADKNGKLSESEVLSHQALFVGSQALNYGRPLDHSEL